MLNSDFHCNRENWRSLNEILFEWKIFQNMIEREDWRKEAQIRNWYSEEAIANVGLQSWNNIFWCPTYYALSKTNSDQISFKWNSKNLHALKACIFHKLTLTVENLNLQLVDKQLHKLYQPHSWQHKCTYPDNN